MTVLTYLKTYLVKKNNTFYNEDPYGYCKIGSEISNYLDSKVKEIICDFKYDILKDGKKIVYMPLSNKYNNDLCVLKLEEGLLVITIKNIKRWKADITFIDNNDVVKIKKILLIANKEKIMRERRKK